MSGFSMMFSPLVPWWTIAAIGGLALLPTAFLIWRRARGSFWRLLAFALLLLGLARPGLT